MIEALQTKQDTNEDISKWYKKKGKMISLFCVLPEDREDWCHSRTPSLKPLPADI